MPITHPAFPKIRLAYSGFEGVAPITSALSESEEYGAGLAFKELVEWLNKECTEHKQLGEGNYVNGRSWISMDTLLDPTVIYYISKRRECPQCWQSLRKAAGLEKLDPPPRYDKVYTDAVERMDSD